jgi:hypothetical protein
MFDIAPKEKPWIAETNTLGPRGRSADCYVLYVHTDQDRASCLVNDTTRWDFYVIPAQGIANSFREQKSVRLSRIRKLCSPVKYADLKLAIDSAIAVEQAQGGIET